MFFARHPGYTVKDTVNILVCSEKKPTSTPTIYCNMSALKYACGCESTNWYPDTCRHHVGSFRVFWDLVCILKPTRRGRILQNGHFSLLGPILPTRSMWQFWASETLQKLLSNASVTLQTRPTSGLHVLLDVFIHCGRFHGQGARRCGALCIFSVTSKGSSTGWILY
jgi:hypothetical protein